MFSFNLRLGFVDIVFFGAAYVHSITLLHVSEGVGGLFSKGVAFGDGKVNCLLF
jgi:hypothetical protein